MAAADRERCPRHTCWNSSKNKTFTPRSLRTTAKIELWSYKVEARTVVGYLSCLSSFLTKCPSAALASAVTLILCLFFFCFLLLVLARATALVSAVFPHPGGAMTVAFLG